jgi:AraC-like DNA-binding protein
MSRAEGSPAAPVTSPGAGFAVEHRLDEHRLDELHLDEPHLDEHLRTRPAEPLRPYVAWYTGYRQRGVPPARHRGLPSPFLTFIITLDEPLVMLAHPDPRQRPGTFHTLLGGLHSAPAIIAHEGAQSGIQVALRPLGTRALLGLPAGELAEIDVPAEAVLSDLCSELRTRVLAATAWPERFAVLDEILLRRMTVTTAGHDVAPEVGWAWRQLLTSGGAILVSDLAEQTGWSGRYLASRFRAEIGLTPKAAARVIRFNRARHLLARQAAATGTAASPGPRTGTGTGTESGTGGHRLADLAAACGYFDQAHLARDFRALAGCPPSQWLAEEFRNVQAVGDLAGGPWVDQAW